MNVFDLLLLTNSFSRLNAYGITNTNNQICLRIIFFYMELTKGKKYFKQLNRNNTAIKNEKSQNDYR